MHADQRPNGHMQHCRAHHLRPIQDLHGNIKAEAGRTGIKLCSFVVILVHSAALQKVYSKLSPSCFSTDGASWVCTTSA